MAIEGEGLNQLGRELQIPASELTKLLNHLQSCVQSNAINPITNLKQRSSLFFSTLLSPESAAAAAFAAAGGAQRHAAFYHWLDRELNRLQRFEFPQIIHLLRRQVEAINRNRHISAD